MLPEVRESFEGKDTNNKTGEQVRDDRSPLTSLLKIAAREWDIK